MTRVNNFIRINAEYPDTWGSSFWITAHTVASAYPEENPTSEDRQHFRQFFDTFEYTLPCKECRDFWKIVLDERPLTDAVLTNRISLSRWLLDVHNMVNEHLGKKGTFSWKQLIYRYEGIDNSKKMVKKIVTLTPQSISGADIIPDKSLGMVNMKTPSAWRNAMRNVNQPPKRAVQQVQEVSVSMSEIYGSKQARRKKCGCKGSSS